MVGAAGAKRSCLSRFSRDATVDVTTLQIFLAKANCQVSVPESCAERGSGFLIDAVAVLHERWVARHISLFIPHVSSI